MRSSKKPAPADEPIIRVVSRHAPHSREAELDAWIHRVIAAAARFPGHLGATVLHDGHDGTGRHVVIHRWLDEASLRAWEAFPEVERLRAEGDAISRREIQIATGLETWFMLPQTRPLGPPPRWKMNLVTLGAAYPLSLAIGAGMVPLLDDLHFLVSQAMVTVVLATMLMFVVLPLLTRLLQRWLYPRRADPAEPTAI